MKTEYLIAAALGAAFAGIASLSFAADDIPKPQSFARYEAMMNRSPFAVATAPAALPAATPNFAKDLYIANAARTPDSDLVTIASTTDKNFKKYLSTKTTVEGYSVPTIEWSDRVGATKVTISKDGQFATLTFNQALLSQPVSAGVPGSPQVQPIMPQQAGVQPAPLQMPVPSTVSAIPAPNSNLNALKGANASLPTPPPRVRGVIQRNPNGAQAATPAVPQGQVVLPDE